MTKHKLTFEEFNKLSKEEKAQAIIRFEEPDNLYRPYTWVKENKD